MRAGNQAKRSTTLGGPVQEAKIAASFPRESNAPARPGFFTRLESMPVNIFARTTVVSALCFAALGVAANVDAQELRSLQCSGSKFIVLSTGEERPSGIFIHRIRLDFANGAVTLGSNKDASEAGWLVDLNGSRLEMSRERELSGQHVMDTLEISLNDGRFSAVVWAIKNMDPTETRARPTEFREKGLCRG